MRIMVSEQIIEEENSCSSTGGGPANNTNLRDERYKPILISTDSYNNINDCDNSTSPRFI